MRALLGPADIRAMLDDDGLAPSRRLGQHFVSDPNTVRKIVRQAGVTPRDLVVEIGPGLGSLTLALRNEGARVVAVEIDRGLVGVLRTLFADDEHVRIVHGDALHQDLAELAGDVERPLLVANLPYNIATALVLRALEADRFAHLLVMVQREVGERWAASPGSPAFGAPSVKIAAYAAARVVGPVSRTAFWPPPRVDSVTIGLQPRPWPFAAPRDRVCRLAEQGFRQRRKQLRNALTPLGWKPAELVRALTAAGLAPSVRAEELTLEQWATVADELASASP